MPPAWVAGGVSHRIRQKEGKNIQQELGDVREYAQKRCTYKMHTSNHISSIGLPTSIYIYYGLHQAMVHQALGIREEAME